MVKFQEEWKEVLPEDNFRKYNLNLYKIFFRRRGGRGGYRGNVRSYNRHSTGGRGRRRSRERASYKRRRSPSYDKYRKNYKDLSTSPETDKEFTLPKEMEKKRKVNLKVFSFINFKGMEKKI